LDKARNKVSVPPPAVQGQIMVMGLSGKAAKAGVAKMLEANATALRIKFLRFMMSTS
jgi:hypothetical protein